MSEQTPPEPDAGPAPESVDEEGNDTETELPPPPETVDDDDAA